MVGVQSGNVDVDQVMNILIDQNTQCSQCPIRHRAVCAKCDDDEFESLNSIKFYKCFAGRHRKHKVRRPQTQDSFIYLIDRSTLKEKLTNFIKSFFFPSRCSVFLARKYEVYLPRPAHGTNV